MAESRVLNIYEKLKKVQQGLKVPKSQYNNFGKYYYRNCEDIQEATKPLMDSVNAVLIISDEIMQIGDRFYVKSTAKFVDCDTGNELSNSAYAREDNEKKGMDLSQITGSTSSYARKYALNGLFCIDDTKDADTNSLINEEQRNEILEELARTGVGKKNLLKNYNLNVLEDMTKGQYDEALIVLKGKPDKEKMPPPVTDEEMRQMMPPEDMSDLPFK